MYKLNFSSVKHWLSHAFHAALFYSFCKMKDIQMYLILVLERKDPTMMVRQTNHDMVFHKQYNVVKMTTKIAKHAIFSADIQLSTHPSSESLTLTRGFRTKGSPHLSTGNIPTDHQNVNSKLNRIALFL